MTKILLEMSQDVHVDSNTLYRYKIYAEEVDFRSVPDEIRAQVIKIVGEPPK
jgi:hypothetical protein